MENKWSRAHGKFYVAFEPANRLPQSIAQSSFRAPAKFCKRARGIHAAARLAVGLRRIPANGAFVPNQRTDLFQQVTNADLFAGAKIHEIGFRIFLRSQ